MLEAMHRADKLNHYLVFEGSRWGHNLVYLYRAPSLRDAIVLFCQRTIGFAIHPDGSITEPCGVRDRKVTYPNLLSYIEDFKADDESEWQIRQLPDWVFEAEDVEVFCGEDPTDIEAHINSCRPYLGRDHPRSRAKAFVWYLRGGCLTSFYKRHRCQPIEIPGRYYEPWRTTNGEPDPPVVKREGTDEDILNQLYLW